VETPDAALYRFVYTGSGYITKRKQKYFSQRKASFKIILISDFFFPRGSTVLEGPWPPHI
jgi:hypothetical protein